MMAAGVLCGMRGPCGAQLWRRTRAGALAQHACEAWRVLRGALRRFVACHALPGQRSKSAWPPPGRPRAFCSGGWVPTSRMLHNSPPPLRLRTALRAGRAHGRASAAAAAAAQPPPALQRALASSLTHRAPWGSLLLLLPPTSCFQRRWTRARRLSSKMSRQARAWSAPLGAARAIYAFVPLRRLPPAAALPMTFRWPLRRC